MYQARFEPLTLTWRQQQYSQVHAVGACLHSHAHIGGRHRYQVMCAATEHQASAFITFHQGVYCWPADAAHIASRCCSTAHSQSQYNHSSAVQAELAASQTVLQQRENVLEEKEQEHDNKVTMGCLGLPFAAQLVTARRSCIHQNPRPLLNHPPSLHPPTTPSPV